MIKILDCLCPLGEENSQLKQELERMTNELKEQSDTKEEQSKEIERLQRKEVELDELLHSLHSEHVSLTRIYGETKQELNDVKEKLSNIENDFENNVDSREISKRLTAQLKSELESLRMENEQRKENEDTQRKIIKDMKTVSIALESIYLPANNNWTQH